MYSTCLFCHQSLGANESIEHFPVGRRLAFDAIKGRLWVVCPHCLRWNLTPLEERWEAIEECEQLFRDQRLRAQTDEIGLAKLPEGLQLVRIGKPLRPEFAAWRYGNVFRARFRRTALWFGGGVVAAGSGAAVGLATGAVQAATAVVTVFPPVAYWIGILLYQSVRGYRDYLRVIHVPREAGGRPYTVFGANIKETDLAPGPTPDDWTLNFRHALGVEPLRGAAARRALGVLLTRVNSTGAGASSTRAAVEHLVSVGGPGKYLDELAAKSQGLAGNYLEERARFRRGEFLYSKDVRFGKQEPRNRGALPNLSVEERLALEMAVHEEDERRALEEEIEPLKAAWRNAEEIAAIADDLLTTPEAREFIRQHRPTKQR